MKQDKGDTIRIVVIASLLVLFAVLLVKAEFDNEHALYHHDKATQMEKKS